MIQNWFVKFDKQAFLTKQSNFYWYQRLKRKNGRNRLNSNTAKNGEKSQTLTFLALLSVEFEIPRRSAALMKRGLQVLP